MKQMFSKIEMLFSKNDNVISELNIVEKNSDMTTIKFSNINFNKALDENLFTIP